MNKKRLRDFSFQIKAAKSGGFFVGHASLWDEVDSYNEKVAPGAFAESLSELAAKGRKLPILWQHHTDEPIGVYDRVEEDSQGLYVEGRLLVDEVGQAAEAYSLLKAKAVSGLSIGYYVRESSLDEKSGIRTLNKIELIEISIVTVPALDSARVSDIKRKLAGGELPTITEFERSLRESGFSRKQAAAIAAKGYRALLSESGDDADEAIAATLLKRLHAFKLSK